MKSVDSTYQLDSDLRPFEEKYKILEDEDILGEGASGTVRLCLKMIRRDDAKPKKKSLKRQVFKRNESSPLVINYLAKLTPKV